MKNGILAISLSLILTACGGGSSGGGTTTAELQDVVFLTTSPDTDDVGESQRIDLTGTATGNGQTLSITGSYSVTRKPNEQWSDEEVVVYDALFVISVPSQGTSVSSAATSYGTLDGSFLMQRMDTGVECYPNENYRDMPLSVKIGENGVLGSLDCSDGSTISASYLIERSSRSSAWAAMRMYATVSAPGSADIYEDIVWHISKDGRVHALDIVAGDGEFSFELTS